MKQKAVSKKQKQKAEAKSRKPQDLR